MRGSPVRKRNHNTILLYDDCALYYSIVKQFNISRSPADAERRLNSALSAKRNALISAKRYKRYKRSAAAYWHPRYAMMGRRSHLTSSVTEDSHGIVALDRTHLLTRQLNHDATLSAVR